MLYGVKVEISEVVEAENFEEAKQKFKDNFMFSDLDYATWDIKKDCEDAKV